MPWRLRATIFAHTSPMADDLRALIDQQIASAYCFNVHSIKREVAKMSKLQQNIIAGIFAIVPIGLTVWIDRGAMPVPTTPVLPMLR
jgi:hypothetical protein